jgi:hypothetical protein
MDQPTGPDNVEVNTRLAPRLGYAPSTQAIREGAPLVLAAPIEKGALPAPLLYQPVGAVHWKVRAAVAK